MLSDASMDVEVVIGQCWVAFGQGAGAIRVSRDAIAAAREIYVEVIRSRMELWEREGPEVLVLFRTTGRLAGQLATAEGCPTIHSRHLREALLRVQRYVGSAALAPTGYCVERPGGGGELV